MSPRTLLLSLLLVSGLAYFNVAVESADWLAQLAFTAAGLVIALVAVARFGASDSDRQR